MASESVVNFRKNVARVLADRRMTIQSLADACDIHRPNVSRIISGDENVTIERAERIAKALSIPLFELLRKNPKSFQEIA